MKIRNTLVLVGGVLMVAFGIGGLLKGEIDIPGLTVGIDDPVGFWYGIAFLFGMPLLMLFFFLKSRARAKGK